MLTKTTRSLVTVLIVLGLAACDDESPTGSPAQGDVTLTLSSRAVVSPARATDELRLSRARFLLRDLKLHTPDRPEEMEFVTGPFIVELELDGTFNEVTAFGVPADTYDEVRFKIHKLDDDNPRDLAAMRDPAFVDFAGPDRPSMLIEGTFDGGNGPEPFTFVSDLSEEQRTPLVPPLQISAQDEEVNVTLIVDTSGWFDDGQGGKLDPRDPSNEDQIEENIERSIDIFEDRDRDGHHDES